jgi:glucan phosphorylase
VASDKTFNVPDLKDSVGWRLNEALKQDLRLIMADRQERFVSNVLRDLVQREAAAVRQRWQKSLARRTKEEDGQP